MVKGKDKQFHKRLLREILKVKVKNKLPKLMAQELSEKYEVSYIYIYQLSKIAEVYKNEILSRDFDFLDLGISKLRDIAYKKGRDTNA